MAETSAREEILGDIRRALERDVKSNPDLGKQLADASGRLDRLVSDIKSNCEEQRNQLIAQFESELGRIGAWFHKATTVESAFQYILGVASVRQARTFAGSQVRLLNGIDLSARLEEIGLTFVTETIDGEWIRMAAEADIGLSGVDYALADTGTLVLIACKGQARSVSLLPPVHIAVVRPEQILSGLSDLFPLLRSEAADEGRDLSSAITFITGPSRTADIELTLVVGVHGPQQLHVVLLQD